MGGRQQLCRLLPRGPVREHERDWEMCALPLGPLLHLLWRNLRLSVHRLPRGHVLEHGISGLLQLHVHRVSQRLLFWWQLVGLHGLRRWLVLSHSYSGHSLPCWKVFHRSLADLQFHVHHMPGGDDQWPRLLQLLHRQLHVSQLLLGALVG